MTATRYVCTVCDRIEQIEIPQVGTADEAARVKGWRAGTTAGGRSVCYCPECTGVDEDYWDRRTLAVASAAGIDAGNTAWGEMR